MIYFILFLIFFTAAVMISVARSYHWLSNQRLSIAELPVQEFRVYESRPEKLKTGPIRYIEDRDMMIPELIGKRKESIEYQAAIRLVEEMRKRGLIDYRHYSDHQSMMPFREKFMTAEVIIHKPEPRIENDRPRL